MDTWAQSNMRDWNGWNVQIEVRAGHCALTLWRRDSSGGTVVWCWGSRAVMACSDHGGSLDVEERSGKLRRSGVTTRRRLVLSDPRARRSSPPRSTKLPRVGRVCTAVRERSAPFRHPPRQARLRTMLERLAAQRGRQLHLPLLLRPLQQQSVFRSPPSLARRSTGLLRPGWFNPSRGSAADATCGHSLASAELRPA
jgi:hypothetical protein